MENQSESLEDLSESDYKTGGFREGVFIVLRLFGIGPKREVKAEALLIIDVEAREREKERVSIRTLLSLHEL